MCLGLRGLLTSSRDGLYLAPRDFCVTQPRQQVSGVGLCLPTASPGYPLPVPLLSGSSVLGSREHLFNSASPSRTEQKANSHLASLKIGRVMGAGQDSHRSQSWSLDCCFHIRFLLPVRPGIFNDSEMKLLHRCEVTGSCRRQTNYLQTQPTTPTQPHKGSQPASLG